MIYSPSIVTVGYYFERWRGIATGIAVCGSGIGTFALSPLNNIFIKAVGWQNTFLIQAGIILLCIICGAMYRPIKPVKIALDENLEESEDEKAEELSRTKNCHGEKTKKFDSFSRAKSHKPPTAAEILHIVGRPTSFETTTSKLSKSSQSLNVHHIGPRYSAEFEKNEKRLSVPNYVDHSGFHGHHKSSKGRSLSHMIDFGRRKRTSSEVSSTLSQGVECIISSRRGTITQVEDRLNIPIQRDDAFFTGSLLRLPQFKPEVRN